MNLKDTLNLPKTGFPMRADLVKKEPIRVSHWQTDKVYEKIQKKNANGPMFVLHDGPPFTNGYVHIGTALNKILKDIIIRYKSMRGFRAPYVPGWDCHGLPIEHKVVKELRAAGKVLDALNLRESCAKYSEKFIAIQRKQFERLGILAAWDDAYRTMDPKYEEHVINFFADCVSRGLVYRSKKPVYWSIPCKTALAEAEIEYKEHVSPSIWVKFPLLGDVSVVFATANPCFVVVWTTTPWTIPSNMAIAVHPNIQYVVIECKNESYLVAEDRVDNFLSDCDIAAYRICAKVVGRDLVGMVARHPIIERDSPLVLAQYVSTESGTGCVHTAPGHGLEDYTTGIENHLEIYCPLDDDGCYENDGQIPKELVGVSVLEEGGVCRANDVVIDMLTRRGMLLMKKNYHHQYPHCWRSKTPVIFRAMAQWFISLDKDGLRDSMQAAVGEVTWVPSWGENRIRAAIASRNDWCISRQRAWGIPLPVFYSSDGHVLLDEGVIRGIAKKIGRFGSNFWFSSREEQLLDGIALPAGWAIDDLTKGMDSLDVWIDSGNSHQAVLKNNHELAWPADMYLEGSDQHRGWFQSSLWVSIISGNSGAPFKSVLTHGFVVGEDRKKISKSDGQPQMADDYVNKFGSDVIRLWIASEDFRNDMAISDDIINHVSATYRTIRNTIRYQMGNLYDFNFVEHGVAQQNMTLIDKWILQKTKYLITEVTAAYETYELHKVYQLINRFCSVELSAIYHDILKDRLYTFAPSAHERRAAQTAIHIIFNTLLCLLGPILTFTCDEALAYFTSGQEFCEQHVQLLDWVSADSIVDFSHEEIIFDVLLSLKSRVNDQLERARQSKLIGQSLDAKVIIDIPSQHDILPILKKYHDIIAEVLIVSQVELREVEVGDDYVISVVHADGEKCPRSWKWVLNLVAAGGFGQVSERSYDALLEKYPDEVHTSVGVV